MVIRGLILIAVISMLSIVAVWFSNNPGTVVIDWLGWRMEPSLALLALAVAAISAVTALVYRFWRAIVHTPRTLARMRQERRSRNGYEALTRGLVAVAAGDPEEARRQVRAAESRLDQPPLTLLLSAQAAQLEGQETAAREYFTAMLERPETEFLGLRGLIMQAERAGDEDAALTLTRRAHKLRAHTGWVLKALYLKEAAAGNWPAADKALRTAIRRRAVPESEGTRNYATILLHRATEARSAGDTGAALKFARKAVDANPDFRAAALVLADLLLAAKKYNAVVRLVEQAWTALPHPDLARIYGEAVKAHDAVRRFQAIETLAALNPDHVESHLALARAALDARLWGEARRRLSEVADQDTRSVRYCRLMAEIEEAENGHTPELHAWLARAAEAPPDPGWVCGRCGARDHGWQAICRHCKTFGEIDWREPPGAAAVIAASTATREPAPALPVAEPQETVPALAEESQSAPSVLLRQSQS